MSVVQECEGVVELKGLFEDLNSAYFVMEHCTGGDLEQLVQVSAVLTVECCPQGPHRALHQGRPQAAGAGEQCCQNSGLQLFVKALKGNSFQGPPVATACHYFVTPQQNLVSACLVMNH